MASLERTLTIIKPDAVARHLIGEIVGRLEAEQLRIVAMKMVQLSLPQAEGFYAVHRRRPFFPSLTKFMTENRVVVMVLEAEEAIGRLRELMGATDPDQAAEGTIRKMFGSTVERNAIHGSDSPETARFEISYFFSAFEIVGTAAELR